MGSPDRALLEAVGLGLLHGPAELLPISSSAHVTLIPWLAGWSYPELAAPRRKGFEVALHAGTAAAVLVAGRPRVDRIIVLACIPPALAGYVLEDRIERLGKPALALGLAVGGLALAAADRCGATRVDAGPLDGLLLGLAQACALIPGVSRSGATTTVARARGFDRAQAFRLSRECGLPITLGAVALRLARHFRVDAGRTGGAGRGRRAERGATRDAVAGGLASAASTLAARRLLDRHPPPLRWCAAYRIGLAAVVVGRLRKNHADG
jgi:undecaprenyl-diphosphatase